MSIDEILLQMKLKAQSDPSLRERLLATKASPTPIADFCAIFRNEGLELYEMDLIEAGEADYAARTLPRSPVLTTTMKCFLRSCKSEQGRGETLPSLCPLSRAARCRKAADFPARLCE